MRGRKPLIPNVIPMRPDGVVDGEAREKELKREAKRKARKMMPKGLNHAAAEGMDSLRWIKSACHLPKLDSTLVSQFTASRAG
jgi:hypothetical protein